MSLPGAVSPSREDRVVASASEIVGGPAGSGSLLVPAVGGPPSAS